VAQDENNNEARVEIPQMKIPQDREMIHVFQDTTYLPFPCRNRRPQSDEQFVKFVEVIPKLYVKIPLLDSIQVPTYNK
jgi:hypothetical protein